MKKQIVFFIIIIFFPLMTIAKTISYVGLGFNKTVLRREGGKSKIDDSMSLGLEYYAPFGLLFGAEISYVNKNVTLENKTSPGSYDPKDSDVIIGDIPINPSCLELAIKLGYNFQIRKAQQLSFDVFTGPMLSLRMAYNSRIQGHTIFLDPDEKGKYKFDYLNCESEGVSDFTVYSLAGVAILYKAIGVEFRFNRALTENKCIRGLTLHDKIDSFQVLLFLRFRYN